MKSSNTSGSSGDDYNASGMPTTTSGNTGYNTSSSGGSASYGAGIDAATMPPSVLRERVGDPEIMHDNPHHNHQGRHGSIAQDQSRHI
jgi:hypothetical protein